MSGNESIDAAHYDQVTTWPRGGLQADIVHIGFGAFHRGHQAVYTDLTNQLSDTRWGIFEINLFGDAQLIENLNAQNGLFSVVETSASQSTHALCVRWLAVFIPPEMALPQQSINWLNLR